MKKLSLVSKKMHKVYLNAKLIKILKANKSEAIKLPVVNARNILTIK